MNNARRKASADEAPIPVLRPQLPKADQLLPYLQRIDSSRIYSNWGPLVLELSDRLCAAFGARTASVVCANSGMSALIAAILATAGRARPQRRFAILPDFTFTASALAVQMCDYQPLLASCDAQSWTFSPEDLLRQPGLLEQVGLVMPVAPFGRAIPQDPWIRFEEQTGIRVVIDGAACFESLVKNGDRPALGRLPVALSFHATKAFGVGEGGCVVTTDSTMYDRVLQAMNFGFLQSRNSAVAGFNGKMPEYAGAVGLAELDGWERKQAAWRTVFGHYTREFADRRIPHRLWGPPQLASSYVLVECADAGESAELMSGLYAEGIDTRLWYGNGLSAHDLYRETPRLDLHGPRQLDPRTLVGLPMAPDLPAADVARVCAAIESLLPAAHPAVPGLAAGPGPAGGRR